MSSLSRLIFWNFSRCYTYCQSKSFYWQNKGFAARSEKAPSIFPKGLGLDLIPHFDPSVLVKWKMIQILSRNAEQMIGHATCWHKEFCQTRATIKSCSDASRGRGKAIHNNDETDTTYAPHRGSDVLMSFLTPFWMYCKYNWWCWKRATFEIRCDLAHHGCQDRQDLWIRTVLTAAVDSAYFSPSNKVWCLIWPLDKEWSSSSCHISGIDSQCTSLWCVRHETSGILCYQAKGARAIAFFCPPANRPHWATACREAHDVL